VREDQIRAALLDARDKLVAQNELLQRLTQGPLLYATVLSSGTELRSPSEPKPGKKARIKSSGLVGTIRRSNDGDGEIYIDVDSQSGLYSPHEYELVEEPRAFVVLVIDGKITEVEAPDRLTLIAGDIVKLSTETMQIVGLADFASLGEVATVSRVIDESLVEIDHDGTRKVVLTGRCGVLEIGDRVVLNSSGHVLLRNLGKDDDQFVFTGVTNVTWNDIGGLDAAKRQMIAAIEQPYLHPDLYRLYNKKPVKGILLYGPPGNGKTMLGKAAATAIALAHGREGSKGFFYVKAPEILNMYVGASEATIRRMFAQARAFEKQHGYPAVIFIDEADAIMGKRGTGISSDVERTIVPMFLTEMDGLEESGALVILSTNRADVLDPAIVRDRRMDRKVKVTRPDQATAENIFELNLRSIPLSNGYTVPQLARDAATALFAPDHVLFSVDLRNETSLDMTFAEIVSGAMITGIVDKATSFAIARDIESGKPDGLRRDDILDAIQATLLENRDLNHEDALREFVDAFRADVTTIRRAALATSN